ncbi:MAG TPA: hypothetical protein DCQ93_07985 [Bacteroidetes bacterium]|nr:hypothetical protein [Bacteroidota bacterium]
MIFEFEMRKLFSGMFMILVFVSCHRKQMIQTSGISAAGKDDLTAASPNSCVVVADVLSISPADSTLTDSWCALFPCEAVIKVSEIKQCGSASTGVIDTDAGIEVHFVFTTAPSEKVGSGVPLYLPGLKEGDRILTTLHIHPSLGGGVEYSVYSYKILQ